MPAWETGRLKSGFGAKAGGLGSVVEELPEELVKAAASRNIKLEIEILSPCFAHYDRSRLQKDPGQVEVFLDGNKFPFTIFRRKIDSDITLVYFWDELQLGWTNALSLYPDDPEIGFKLYATVSQAMAGYIKKSRFHSIHSHDYHVGIIPFYLGKDYLAEVPHHLTIHNATYQGVFQTHGNGPGQLERIGLSGSELYDRYFRLNDTINFLRASVLITHETGGKVTTVSGDLQAGWGYAAELLLNHDEILNKARQLNKDGEVKDVFVPNCGLNDLRDVGLIGITNGLSPHNRSEKLPELKASNLLKEKEKKGGKPLFSHPLVEKNLLDSDHNFGADSLEIKSELKRLLHLELFGIEPEKELVFLVAVGRLASQKNFELIADTAERVMEKFPYVKYAIIANPPEGDRQAMDLQNRLLELQNRFADSFFYTPSFSQHLSRLILAGGDFALIPSRFEPCGLVDYEACALGTIVIGHNTGGLSKVKEVAYLYEWLDSGDPEGESEAFLSVLEKALETFRKNPKEHREMVISALQLDSGWPRAAEQYIEMFLYGILGKAWQEKKKVIVRQVDHYARKLFKTHPWFLDFYHPSKNDILEERMNQLVAAARNRRNTEKD